MPGWQRSGSAGASGTQKYFRGVGGSRGRQGFRGALCHTHDARWLCLMISTQLYSLKIFATHKSKNSACRPPCHSLSLSVSLARDRTPHTTVPVEDTVCRKPVIPNNCHILMRSVTGRISAFGPLPVAMRLSHGTERPLSSLPTRQGLCSCWARSGQKARAAEAPQKLFPPLFLRLTLISSGQMHLSQSPSLIQLGKLSTVHSSPVLFCSSALSGILFSEFLATNSISLPVTSSATCSEQVETECCEGLNHP